MTQSKRAEALAEHYVDQLASWAHISTRPLFGACGLYRQGHVFAMVWQGALYFKVDDDSRLAYVAAQSHTLGYVSNGEQHALKSYWEVPADVVEDRETLCLWAERAYQIALQGGKH
ncbi:TfoX/Sxy family protein [Glaciimonas sp. PCH181]|uniref:TfoX/Sxy family protein n=1 Tax=Glaciimonas sp. PCH181 TaxID=2133943 RepID=UPI000D3442B0|nr:TfoX/Sxy family protein [Glaciimonas sp. PCH181]PUA19556.1 TfoX/Sxy family transcriptional regulator [Glaciimonas sp. PCH181]